MNELVKFDFEGTIVRTIMVDSEPWFVLKDVCSILEISNSKDVADRLDNDEKLIRSDLTSLGQRGGWLINESGLYSVIIRSDKPEAKKFKKWITAEVLPAIRKTGSYSLQESKPLSTLDLLEMSIKQLREQESRINTIDDRLSIIEDAREDSKKKLTALPLARVTPHAKTTRQTIVELIRNVSFNDGISYSEIWAKLYKEFSIRYEMNIRKRAEHSKISRIEWVDQNNYMEDLYALAMELFIPKPTLKK